MRPTIAADKDENVFLGGFAIHGLLQIERDHAPTGNTPPQVEFFERSDADDQPRRGALHHESESQQAEDYRLSPMRSELLTPSERVPPELREMLGYQLHFYQDAQATG